MCIRCKCLGICVGGRGSVDDGDCVCVCGGDGKRSILEMCVGCVCVDNDDCIGSRIEAAVLIEAAVVHEDASLRLSIVARCEKEGANAKVDKNVPRRFVAPSMG